MRMTDYDYTFKLMMLGDASVGKTSLTLRYISGYFMEDLKLTIGVDFYSKTTLFNEKKVKLQMWDFGGEERFRFLLSQYCKGANGAFFLYDITNVRSIDHLPDWTQIVRENAGDIPIMLIGSKKDLDEFRTIPREDGILAARKYNLTSFIELSSKTGENVERAFKEMTDTLFEDY
jgi:small GTP-binding protein